MLTKSGVCLNYIYFIIELLSIADFVTGYSRLKSLEINVTGHPRRSTFRFATVTRLIVLVTVFCTTYVGRTGIYTVTQKNPPWGFVAIFPKRLGIFRPNFTCLLCVPVYARLRIFIQLSPTLMKLSILSATIQHLIWHN